MILIFFSLGFDFFIINWSRERFFHQLKKYTSLSQTRAKNSAQRTGECVPAVESCCVVLRVDVDSCCVANVMCCSLQAWTQGCWVQWKAINTNMFDRSTNRPTDCLSMNEFYLLQLNRTINSFTNRLSIDSQLLHSQKHCAKSGTWIVTWVIDKISDCAEKNCEWNAFHCRAILHIPFENRNFPNMISLRWFMAEIAQRNTNDSMVDFINCSKWSLACGLLRCTYVLTDLFAF